MVSHFTVHLIQEYILQIYQIQLDGFFLADSSYI
jgi:hypothetical protein